MSQNHWETQPRKDNGEFTFRYKSRFMENIFKEVHQKLRDDQIKKITRGGSYGRSARARRYRQWQAKLISEGRFTEAEYMDIKNIRRKFGNRYNKSINEKLVYENELISDGVING